MAPPPIGGVAPRGWSVYCKPGSLSALQSYATSRSGAKRNTWTGSAADLLRAGADLAADGALSRGSGWPQNPRALAGRLRRAQSVLRALGIAISFSREGRARCRIIRMHANLKDTVGAVRDNRTSAATGR